MVVMDVIKALVLPGGCWESREGEGMEDPKQPAFGFLGRLPRRTHGFFLLVSDWTPCPALAFQDGNRHSRSITRAGCTPNIAPDCHPASPVLALPSLSHPTHIPSPIGYNHSHTHRQSIGMEDDKPSDMLVNIVMVVLVVGGALLLWEIVRLADFCVRQLALILVRRGRTSASVEGWGRHAALCSEHGQYQILPSPPLHTIQDPFSDASLAYLRQQQQQQRERQQWHRQGEEQEMSKPLLASPPIKARPTLSSIGLPDSPEKQQHKPRRATVGEQQQQQQRVEVVEPHPAPSGVYSTLSKLFPILGTSAGEEGHTAEAVHRTLDRQQQENDQLVTALLEEQETKLLKTMTTKNLNLIGLLLDDIFDREDGSAIVRAMPPNLRHQSWVIDFLNRIAEADTKRTHALASNRMEAKKRGTDIPNYFTTSPHSMRATRTLRSAPTPRGTKFSVDGLTGGPGRGTVNLTDHHQRLHYHPPGWRERMRYWHYYLCVHRMEGKYATLLLDTPLRALPVGAAAAGEVGVDRTWGGGGATIVTAAGASCSSPSSAASGATPTSAESCTTNECSSSHSSNSSSHSSSSSSHNSSSTQQGSKRRSSLGYRQEEMEGPRSYAQAHSHTVQNHNNVTQGQGGVPHYMLPIIRH